MSNVFVEEATLRAIADAIRAKTDTNDTFFPRDMASAIESIVGGSTATLGAYTGTFTRSSKTDYNNTSQALYYATTIPDFVMVYIDDSKMASGGTTYQTTDYASYNAMIATWGFRTKFRNYGLGSRLSGRLCIGNSLLSYFGIDDEDPNGYLKRNGLIRASKNGYVRAGLDTHDPYNPTTIGYKAQYGFAYDVQYRWIAVYGMDSGYTMSEAESQLF